MWGLPFIRINSLLAVKESSHNVVLPAQQPNLFQLTFDGTSRLTVTLVKFDRYSGSTGGLCGFYDNDGQ